MILYRKATKNDIRPALDLVERVWIEFDLPDMDIETLETMQNEITQNEDMVEKYTSGRSTMFIAADREKIVGVIGAGNDGYVRLLFVEGLYHHQGIATELLHRMVCDLKLRGFDIIKLNSSRHGLPFYKNFGFIQTGEEQKLNGFISTPMEYSPSEIWDVLNEDGNKTGRFHERGRKMATGDYHIIVHVWKCNAKDEWLIDKRASRYGNNDIDDKWETTGGCAIAGDDSLNAALREVKEELGIDLNPQSGTLFSSTAQKWEDGHTAFVDVWIFDYDEPIENIIFDEREVCDAMWASADKIRTMMATGEFLDYPYFEEMFEKWRGRNEQTARHNRFRSKRKR